MIAGRRPGAIILSGIPVDHLHRSSGHGTCTAIVPAFGGTCSEVRLSSLTVWWRRRVRLESLTYALQQSPRRLAAEKVRASQSLGVSEVEAA
jgi:hypothetical protein